MLSSIPKAQSAYITVVINSILFCPAYSYLVSFKVSPLLVGANLCCLMNGGKCMLGSLLAGTVSNVCAILRETKSIGNKKSKYSD